MSASALDVARAALAAAETRTGVRAVDPQMVAPAPVQEPLGALFDAGRLPTGGATVVAGSRSLLLALLGMSQWKGDWVAFVGMPDIGLLAAADFGIALERTVVVPDVALRGPEVIAALLDGITYVVVGPQAALVPSDRRRLLARARDRGTGLVSPSEWEQSTVRLEVAATRWSGPDRGAYFLRRCELDVVRRSRGVPDRWRVTLPMPGGTLEHAVAGTATRMSDASRLRLVQ